MQVMLAVMPPDLMSSGSRRSEFEWHKIWQLKVPNKVKTFIWRLAHNSLQVRRKMWQGVGFTGHYMSSKVVRLDEDCTHLFLKCKYIKQCWRLLASYQNLAGRGSLRAKKGRVAEVRVPSLDSWKDFF